MTIQGGTFLQNILLLPRLLRQAGLPASPERSMDYARALTHVDIGRREQVFHAARSILVSRKEHLDLFATIFQHFWEAVTADRRGGPPPHRPPPRRRHPRSTTIMTLMAEKASAGDHEQDVHDRSSTFSNLEVLQQKAFAEMTQDELDAIYRLIREMRWSLSQRVTRRRVPDRRGHRLDLSSVLRTASRFGGVPIQLAWQRQKVKQRPIVLLADMSGSMEKYARLILQFFYSVSQSFHEIECFVFGTRLTRITPQLKFKNVDLAIDEAAHRVFDWAGGTRIGSCLHTFNHDWGRRVLRRGAVVIVVSDGWDRGEVAVLDRELKALQLRSHRLIWLNPHLGAETYEPIVEGMAAAMPYIDDFLPIHNMQDLKTLSQHLAGLGRRSTHSRSTRLRPAEGRNVK